MIVFKAIVVGLLAWELIRLLRRRRQTQPEPTYVFIPADGLPPKEGALLNQRGPPPSYDAQPIKY